MKAIRLLRVVLGLRRQPITDAEITNGYSWVTYHNIYRGGGANRPSR